MATPQEIIMDAEWSDIFAGHRETVYLTMTGTAEKSVEAIVDREELKPIITRQFSGESSNITLVRNETHIRIKAVDYSTVTVQKDKIRFKANKSNNTYVTKIIKEVIEDTGKDIKVMVG